MDDRGNIYELTEDELKQEPRDPIVKEDMARLEGFLKGRAESDKVKHDKVAKRRGKLVWDSQRQGPYRKYRPKENEMGIEDVEELSGNQGDPGDENDNVQELILAEDESMSEAPTTEDEPEAA